MHCQYTPSSAAPIATRERDADLAEKPVEGDQDRLGVAGLGEPGGSDVLRAEVRGVEQSAGPAAHFAQAQRLAP